MIYMIRQVGNTNIIEIMKENAPLRMMNQTSVEFMNQWCLYHGSTFDGRRVACAQQMMIKQKVPILISEQTRDILFPTKSMEHDDCIWINYQGITEIKKMKTKTMIIFRNDKKVVLDIDIRCMRRQLERCEKYLTLIKSFCEN
ncbi:MAG: competence protein ComK [Longicatena sp.]